MKVVNNFLGAISYQQRATTPGECTLKYVTLKRTNNSFTQKTPCSLHTASEDEEEEVYQLGGKAATLCWKISVVGDEKL
jgi:hypothetical protein